MDEGVKVEVERQLAYFDEALKLIESGIFKILTGTGDLVSFVPKWEQKRLYELVRREIAKGREARIVILKARQVGFSTAIAVLYLALVLVRGGVDVLVTTHEVKSQRRIWKIYKTAWRHLPEEYRTVATGKTDKAGNAVRADRARYDSKQELELEDTEAHIGVYVAAGGELGRSGASHLQHLSEFARWPNQAEDLNATMKALPKRPGSIAIIETTANGWGDPFHRLWQRAESGESEDGISSPWVPFFLPWWKEKSYQAPLRRAKVGGHTDFEFTDEENALVAEIKARYDIGLSKTQLQWRRNELADCDGDVALFDQENPSTPEHAFRASGSKIFDATALEWIRTKYGTEPELFDIRVGLQGGVYLRADPKGQLRRYVEPEQRRCIIGADPTHGLSKDSDPAAAAVVDVDTLEVCAVWEGVIDQSDFGDVLVGLARYYNDARLVIESNIGVSTCERVYKGLRYTNIEFHRVVGKDIQEPRHEMGFKTTPANRTVAINVGKRLVSERMLAVYDLPTLHEMESFREVKTSSGKFKARAASGKQDNLVMALLIALYIGNDKYGWTKGEALLDRRENPVEFMQQPKAAPSWREKLKELERQRRSHRLAGVFGIGGR